MKVIGYIKELDCKPNAGLIPMLINLSHNVYTITLLTKT